MTNVIVNPAARVHAKAVLEAMLGQGEELEIDAEAQVGNCVIEGSSWIRQGAVVKDRARVTDACIGLRTIIGRSTRVMGGSDIGCQVAVGDGCSIGRFVRVGDGVRVGNGSSLGDLVKVGRMAVIGDDCQIGEHSSVGEGAIVLSGTVIPFGSAIEAGRTVGPSDFVQEVQPQEPLPAWVKVAVRIHKAARRIKNRIGL